MKVKSHFKETYRQVGGTWKEILLVYTSMAAKDRHLVDGQKMERIKKDDLPPYVFLDCVKMLSENLASEFAELDANDFFDQFDFLNGTTKLMPDEEGYYEYVCPRMYLRTVIFAGFWLVMQVEHPELQEINNRIAKRVVYDDTQKVYYKPFIERYRIIKDNPKILNDRFNSVQRELHQRCFDDLVSLDERFRKRWYTPYERYKHYQILKKEVLDIMGAAGEKSDGIIIINVIDYLMEMLSSQYEKGEQGPWKTSELELEVFGKDEKDKMIDELKKKIDELSKEIADIRNKQTEIHPCVVIQGDNKEININGTIDNKGTITGDVNSEQR